MEVGTTKDQGLYNKPSAAVHAGALAAGTLPQYNTVDVILSTKFLSFKFRCWKEFAARQPPILVCARCRLSCFKTLCQLQIKTLSNSALRSKYSPFENRS